MSITEAAPLYADSDQAMAVVRAVTGSRFAAVCTSKQLYDAMPAITLLDRGVFRTALAACGEGVWGGGLRRSVGGPTSGGVLKARCPPSPYALWFPASEAAAWRGERTARLWASCHLRPYAHSASPLRRALCALGLQAVRQRLTVGPPTAPTALRTAACGREPVTAQAHTKRFVP